MNAAQLMSSQQQQLQKLKSPAGLRSSQQFQSSLLRALAGNNNSQPQALNGTLGLSPIPTNNGSNGNGTVKGTTRLSSLFDTEKAVRLSGGLMRHHHQHASVN